MPEQSPDLLMTNADLPDERKRGDSSGAPGSFRTFWGPNPARSLAEWLCRPSGMFGGLSTPISFQRTIPGRSSIFVEKKRDRLSSDLGGDPEDPHPWVVRGDIEGVRFDILPQIAGTRVERGTPLPGLGIRVCGVSDFIALTCDAGGPQDLVDVANLISVRPDLREEALRIARDYGISHRLLPFLKLF